MQLLRVYNLTDALQGDSRELLENLQHITEQEPSADKVYAMSELAYLSARKIEKQDKAKALDLYGAAVLHAYAFLFDDRLAATRNCYDPQFRGACDLYNSALESALRLSCDRGELRPGTTKTIHTAAGTWDITCVLRGGVWQPDDFDHFEFVSDYEMKGLKNHYQTHGLGVPLIVVRRSYKGEPEAARYYPPGLSFPVTAFLRPVSGPNQAGRNQGLSGTLRSAGDQRHPRGASARAAGKRPDDAAGLLPLEGAHGVAGHGRPLPARATADPAAAISKR